MRTVAPSLAALIALTIPAYAQTRIDAINTNFRWLGPDDRSSSSDMTIRRSRTCHAICRVPRPAGLRVVSGLQKTQAGSQ
jgi:hypothetical protein